MYGNAEFMHGGGIVLSITCTECYDNEITHMIKDVDDLNFQSIESIEDDIIEKNKWSRECICTECLEELRGERNEKNN